MFKKCQGQVFSEEIRAILSKKMLKRSSSILALSPMMMDDGVLRAGGRIRPAELPYENRHPVILPAKHPLTEGIITAFHKLHLHLGTDMIVSQVRQHYGIIKGREAVKRIGRKRAVCIKKNRNLPKERLSSYKPPFYCTAVDYFGPLEVGIGRNRTAKRYGSLFTCMSTRAVFVDLAQSLSTPDFLNSLRRFISIDRMPKTICSDNCTNFVGAEKELVKSVQIMTRDPTMNSWVAD